MATCSSLITDSSAESNGATDHDLANFSTKVRLAEVFAAKKSVVGAWVFTEGYLMAHGAACWLLRDPTAAEDLHASS